MSKRRTAQNPTEPPAPQPSLTAFRSPSFRRLSDRATPEMILALIHDAISHMIVPITKLGDASPALERIALSLEGDRHPIIGRVGFGGSGTLLSYGEAIGSAAEYAPIPVAALTLDLKVISCNSAMARLLARERSEIVGRSALDFIIGRLHRPPNADEIRRQMVRGEIVKWRGKARRGDGQLVAIRSLIWPIFAPHRSKVIACGVMDFRESGRSGLSAGFGV